MTLEAADDKNKTWGVTPAIRESMRVGSMFGWDCPAAYPEHSMNAGAKPLVEEYEAKNQNWH